MDKVDRINNCGIRFAASTVLRINVDICLGELPVYLHHVYRRGGQVRVTGLMSSHDDLFVELKDRS